METQAHANLSRPTSYGDDVQDLDDAVRAGLAARADPDAAPAMQRYMKSALPFRGVPKPAREELVRELVASRPAPSPSPSPDEFGTAVRSLWDGARYREERYRRGHHRRPRPLPAQGHRLGAAPALARRPRVGPAVRRHPSAPLAAVAQGGDEAPAGLSDPERPRAAPAAV